jgi:hypothetical protein
METAHFNIILLKLNVTFLKYQLDSIISSYLVNSEIHTRMVLKEISKLSLSSLIDLSPTIEYNLTIFEFYFTAFRNGQSPIRAHPNQN